MAWVRRSCLAGIQKIQTLVQGGALVVAIVFIVVNIIVDMLYLLINPRIVGVRHESERKLNKVTATSARFAHRRDVPGIEDRDGYPALVVLMSVLAPFALLWPRPDSTSGVPRPASTYSN